MNRRTRTDARLSDICQVRGLGFQGLGGWGLGVRGLGVWRCTAFRVKGHRVSIMHPLASVFLQNFCQDYSWNWV